MLWKQFCHDPSTIMDPPPPPHMAILAQMYRHIHGGRGRTLVILSTVVGSLPQGFLSKRICHLDALTKHHEWNANVVKPGHFVRLSIEASAEKLSVSPRLVRRNRAFGARFMN